jgi:hypothetical protein
VPPINHSKTLIFWKNAGIDSLALMRYAIGRGELFAFYGKLNFFLFRQNRLLASSLARRQIAVAHRQRRLA